jgi:hypothetical protein
MSSPQEQNEPSNLEEKLFCTVSGCKRSSGRPFNRKDNFHEHLRRVHGITDASKGPQLQSIAHAATELIGSPTSHAECGWLESSAGSRDGSGGLESEIQQAKVEGLKKDERIRQLEEMDERRNKRLAEIEAQLARSETRNNLWGLEGSS